MLSGHPALRQAVVVFAEPPSGPGEEDRAAGGRLVAFLVGAQAAAPAPDVLREYLSARLPLPAVPEAFVPLDTLPLLPNGKVDRSALDRRVAAGEVATLPAATVPHVAPRNPVEEPFQPT